MIVVLIIFSVGLLALIIYYAISPKSSRFLKLAATIALGLIGIAIIVCAIIIIIGPKQDPNAVLLPFVTEESGQPASSSSNSFTDIIIFLVLFGLISLVIVRSMKEQKKMAKLQAEKPAKPQTIQEEAAPMEESTSFLDDESFDLGGLED